MGRTWEITPYPVETVWRTWCMLILLNLCHNQRRWSLIYSHLQKMKLRYGTFRELGQSHITKTWRIWNWNLGKRVFKIPLWTMTALSFFRFIVFLSCCSKCLDYFWFGGGKFPDVICDHIEARLEGGDKENWLYSGGSSKLCSNHLPTGLFKLEKRRKKKGSR